jgi:hypothetical protein
LAHPVDADEETPAAPKIAHPPFNITLDVSFLLLTYSHLFALACNPFFKNYDFALECSCCLFFHLALEPLLLIQVTFATTDHINACFAKRVPTLLADKDISSQLSITTLADGAYFSQLLSPNRNVP